jgi:hypothetical protein
MVKTYFKSSWNAVVKSLATILLVTLAGCGGGGGGGPASTSPAAYTVGGTVTGLQLPNSVALQDDGGNTTTVTADGSFTFSGTVSNGATYAVTVGAQPSGQNCTVTNGSGTIAGGNISNVAVNCQDINYNVGATVTGLSNGSVVLQLNGDSDLTFTSNTTANFNATVPSDSTYDVTVLTQPTGETCAVTNGKGTVINSNVVASVTCSPNTYTIGGTVSGLATGNQVTLQDNGGNNTTISANGPFVFSIGITNGSNYAVTVSSQPAGQNCTVTNGSGTVSSADISNVAVVCSAVSTFNVGAAVTGLLANTSVVLQLNGGSNLTFTANGTANFNLPLSSGATYAVTVLTQPANETCTVSNGSGTISNASVTVSVTCASNAANNPAGTANVALTTIPVPTAPENVIPLAVDAGPVAGSPSINVGYVSVTVCTPGTSGSTAACQTIDHVTLDTGSYGLRLLNSQLSANLNLPAATNVSGHAVGECVAFVIGATWGSVRLADVYLNGEVARSIPLQDIGDKPAGYSGIPRSCNSYGGIQDTQAALGSNGILGVGNFVDDCDPCVTQNIPGTYYDCTSSGCTSSTITVSQMVKNPVAEFQNPTSGVAQDNNGEMMTLPAVGAGGSTGITGTVTFGIGTQTNNALGGAVYPTDIYGNFITIYKGTTMSSSYLDSGSNGFFFNDNTIPTCSSGDGWYCPASTLALTATNKGATGSPSGSVSFSLVNADNLFNNSSIVAGNIGAPGSAGSFAWGLPFFYGRTVFTAISGASTPGGVGPYWAY